MIREILSIILGFGTVVSFVWFVYKFFNINIQKTYNNYQKAIDSVQEVLIGKISREEFLKQTEEISKRIGGWYIPVIPLIIFFVLYVGIIIVI